MEAIPEEEIRYNPQSFADHATRVFYWRGEIYRGLRYESAAFFRKLFREGVIQKLIDRKFLVQSELTCFALNGYDTVIRHREISFISYPDEWCAAMYKDAALMTVDFGIELAQWDLTLEDAHPWNVLFDVDNSIPIYVDWGSIVPIDGSEWSDYDLFSRFFLYPLVLMSHREDRIARLLIPADEFGVLESDVFKATGRSCLSKTSLKASLATRIGLFLEQKLEKSLNSCHRHLGSALRLINPLFSKSVRTVKPKLACIDSQSHLSSLKKVRREVESIALPAFQPLDDNGNSGPSAFPAEDWTLKQRNVYNLLKQFNPSSVLDIGAGSGWYSELAALLGSKVVAFDIDEACITRLYYSAREKKLPILPLMMNFTRPTPARGLADRAGIGAFDRLRCDLVLALGLVHDIALGVVHPVVGKQIVNFEQIAEGLARFAKRWVIAEFIPFEAQEFDQDRVPRSPGYKLDDFIGALRKQFGDVTMMPSHPHPCVLLVCQK